MTEISVVPRRLPIVPGGHDVVVPLDDLVPFPGNARRGNLDAIASSLEHHGQFKPIVVNRRTSQILAGNHVWAAARSLGWTHVAVVLVDVDEDTARRIVLVDNKTSDGASYDNDALLASLQQLDGLDGSGFTAEDLGALLDELTPPLVDEGPPPLPAVPVTQLGELIELGPHRLLCGDATDADCLRRVLGGRSADAMWTDPPYGVDYVGKTPAKLRVANDTTDGLDILLAAAFAGVDECLRPGAPVYVAHPAGPSSMVFATAFTEAGWSWRQTLIWAKDSAVLGRSDYHYQHEPLLYGFKPGPGRLGRGGPAWRGDNAQTSILEVPRPSASREHPTSKPPELIARCLANSTARGERVLDPFAGSGSTLVAAEQLGRIACLVEIDPGYCDVIVDRCRALTGVEPVRGVL